MLPPPHFRKDALLLDSFIETAKQALKALAFASYYISHVSSPSLLTPMGYRFILLSMRPSVNCVNDGVSAVQKAFFLPIFNTIVLVFHSRTTSKSTVKTCIRP